MGTTVSSIVESCNLQLFCPRASPSVRQLQVGYPSMSHPIVVSRPWLRLFGLTCIIRYFKLVSTIEYTEVVKMVKFKGAVDVEQTKVAPSAEKTSEAFQSPNNQNSFHHSIIWNLMIDPEYMRNPLPSGELSGKLKQKRRPPRCRYLTLVR